MKLERCDRCKTEVRASHADNWTDVSAIGRQGSGTVIPDRSYCPACAAAFRWFLSKFEGESVTPDFSKE